MADIVSILDEGLGNSSYLVDLGDGRGLVLDPERDPTPYLAAGERRALRIAYSVETHLHADFVSGSRELAAAGAQVVASAAGGLEFPHRALGDGDEIDLGGLTLRALATPGHTPEHLAYLLLDAVAQPAVRELQATGSRGDHLGAGGGQLPAAGHEIGVQVGSPRCRRRAHRAAPLRPGRRWGRVRGPAPALGHRPGRRDTTSCPSPRRGSKRCRSTVLLARSGSPRTLPIFR